MLAEVKALIEHYKLEKLPVEETLFVSTYHSQTEFGDHQPCGTAMIGLYCEQPLSFSRFHRLKADEVWHFYGGDPLRLILLYPDGSSRDVILGSDPFKGQLVQFVIPAGVWQAGNLIAGGRYALFGCSMAPGFSGSMFEGGGRSILKRQYPERTADIARFGCDDEATDMPEGFAS
jgi:predicted cupin superfamily sugar epimerase